MAFEGLFFIDYFSLCSNRKAKRSLMDAKTPIEHAGSGRKKNRPRRTPKGRQADPQALAPAPLAARATEMKLAMTEVYEVATFYAHFDVVKEGEAPPPPITVRVCD